MILYQKTYTHEERMERLGSAEKAPSFANLVQEWDLNKKHQVVNNVTCQREDFVKLCTAMSEARAWNLILESTDRDSLRAAFTGPSCFYISDFIMLQTLADECVIYVSNQTGELTLAANYDTRKHRMDSNAEALVCQLQDALGNQMDRIIEEESPL